MAACPALSGSCACLKGWGSPRQRAAATPGGDAKCASTARASTTGLGSAFEFGLQNKAHRLWKIRNFAHAGEKEFWLFTALSCYLAGLMLLYSSSLWVMASHTTILLVELPLCSSLSPVLVQEFTQPSCNNFFVLRTFHMPGTILTSGDIAVKDTNIWVRSWGSAHLCHLCSVRVHVSLDSLNLDFLVTPTLPLSPWGN